MAAIIFNIGRMSLFITSYIFEWQFVSIRQISAKSVNLRQNYSHFFEFKMAVKPTLFYGDIGIFVMQPIFM